MTGQTYLYALLDNGQVYYLKENALNFEPHPITEYIFNTGETTCFLVEKNGDIWVGGINTLWHYQAKTGQVANFNKDLRDVFDHEATFRQIMKDRTGVIWVATDFGALKISQFDNRFSNYLNEGNEFCNNGFCSIRGITEDSKGHIYFSYYNSIHVLNPKTERIRPLLSRSHKIGTPYGLLHHSNKIYTGSGLAIDIPSRDIDTIFVESQKAEGVLMQDSLKNIWFGNGKQLKIYNPTTNSLSDFQDPTGILDTANFKTISYLLPSQIGYYFWMGTVENGIYKISYTEGVLAHYSTHAKIPTFALSHNRVLGIVENGPHQLWLATAKGINKIDLATDEVMVYTKKHGMPNNFVNGILLEADSVIWASTDNGLTRLSIEHTSFYNFLESDGLSDNEFNRVSAFKASNNRFYFGGLNGVNAFFPNKSFIHKSTITKEAKLVFTAFSKYDGRTDNLILKQGVLEQSDTINLTHTDEFFTFRFALADFTNPNNRRYSYKLEGFENDWSESTTQNLARYNNIPAGDYIFKVRAAAGGEDWLEEELSINIRVEKAFYKELWFLLTIALLIMFGVYLIARYRIYSLKKHEKELEEIVNERTQELELEKRKSDELLLNILPADIAEELKSSGKAKAQRHDCVTVFFSDFKNFTSIAHSMEPEALVTLVDFCFRAFDEIMEKYDLEKIKTIGDAYMCIGGINCNESDAAIRIVEAALEIQSFLNAISIERKERQLPYFEARIGVHTGEVVAGIVGIKKFAYDIWGDTVNIAARMEQNSEVGRVNVSESTYLLIKERFACTPRGKIAAKNKGEIDMYFVDGLKN